MSQMPRAKLIAVGNPFWRDDAADPASLLEAMQGADLVVIVDAIRSGAAPGSIQRIEVSDGDQLPDRRPRDSSHTLALGDLLALARTLDRLPDRLVLIGIEAAELGPGTGLSPHAAAAVELVTRQTLRDLGVRVPSSS